MEDVRREVNSFKGEPVSQKASGTERLKRNDIAPLVQKGKGSLTKHVDNDMEDIADATTKIQKQVIKWQHGQNDVRLRQLKEHKDYEVQIEQSVHPNDTFTAAILCTMCNKKIRLGINQNIRVKLSNWIRHIKACVQEKKESKLALTKYCSSSSSLVSSPDISAPALSKSEMATPDVQTSDTNMRNKPAEAERDNVETS